MSVLFDAAEMEPGRPALPDGWNVYDARAEFHLPHDRGPVDTTADEVAQIIAGELANLGDQGVSDVTGRSHPLAREDGSPIMNAVGVVFTARVAAPSQVAADATLARLVPDAVTASEQREGEP